MNNSIDQEIFFGLITDHNVQGINSYLDQSRTPIVPIWKFKEEMSYNGKL